MRSSLELLNRLLPYRPHFHPTQYDPHRQHGFPCGPIVICLRPQWRPRQWERQPLSNDHLRTIPRSLPCCAASSLSLSELSSPESSSWPSSRLVTSSIRHQRTSTPATRRRSKPTLPMRRSGCCSSYFSLGQPARLW